MSTNFLNWLFGRKTQPDNSRVLVQIIDMDHQEHYQWATPPLLLSKFEFCPVWIGDDLSVFERNGVWQIDEVCMEAPEIYREIHESKFEVAECPEGFFKLYCLYTMEDFFPHYVWSKTNLNVLTAEFKPAFKNDRLTITDAVSVKIIPEGNTFRYWHKFYKLIRNERRRLKIIENPELEE
jgi:hypothetical protein